MTIKLDGITLNPMMVWEERFSPQTVAQNVRRTLGGVTVVSSAQLSKGEPITLSAREVNGILIGVLRMSIVEEVLERAGVPGAQYVLEYNGGPLTVIFRHDEPPAVSMTPLIAKSSYGPNDLMRGQIRLLTV
jgi:hypothetical protein